MCRCRASNVYRLPSFCHCCRSSRSPLRFIREARRAGMAMASCPAISSRRAIPCRLTCRKRKRCAWRAAAGDPGTFIRLRNITDGMATGTISAGPVFTAGNIMAAASAPAGRRHPSGRCGIAADSHRGDSGRAAEEERRRPRAYLRAGWVSDPELPRSCECRTSA